MKKRLLAVLIAITTIVTIPGIASATHADPHIGNSLGMPDPNSEGTAYTYYIEVCLDASIGGGPTWDTYGTGFNTQDRIRDAMNAWNALNGEAKFFASNTCSAADTFIQVRYDTYSNFAELQRTESQACGVGSGTCWETAILHWSSAVSWWVGSGSPPVNLYDAQSMFTHELGHALYLDHSSNSAATMAANLPVGSAWMRNLEGGPCNSISTSDVFGYKYSFSCTH